MGSINFILHNINPTMTFVGLCVNAIINNWICTKMTMDIIIVELFPHCLPWGRQVMFTFSVALKQNKYNKDQIQSNQDGEVSRSL